MNTANKLTILRVALVPFFAFFLLYGQTDDYLFRFIALIIFLAAAFTDFLDGYIARKYNQITDFGKLADPLADKFLVCAALIALCSMNELAAWVVIIIVCREFLITGMRQLALENGRNVIAASVWGKLKTILQIAMLSSLLLGMGNGSLYTPLSAYDAPWSVYAANALIILTVAATVISAADYIYAYVRTNGK